MPDVFNPVDVEREIDAIRNRIAAGVVFVSNAEAAAKAARRDYDRAYAHAYLSTEGAPVHERKYRATLATMVQREAAEIAESTFEHAKRQAWALNHELAAWQTISRSVLAMYGAVKA